MTSAGVESGFATIDGARLYYEIAGRGLPFVMIHAGVADHRQWNNEFAAFASGFRVLRYDLRGYGKSEPVEGEYSHLQDLTWLLDRLHLDSPAILMGCSMGGGLAMDFALTYPSRARALIMVDAGPSGLKLDVPVLPKAAEAEKAYEAGDLDLVAELETQIWFDGVGRTSSQVDPTVRRLVYEMNRLGLAHDAKRLGKRLPDTSVSAVQQLDHLHIPVLVIIGDHDTPFMQAAATFVVEKVATSRKVTIQNAAHLPNMEHPEEFRRIVTDFVAGLSLRA